MTVAILYASMCLAAALGVVEHTALSWQANRRGATWLMAVLFPAVDAWRAGRHVAAIRYGLWIGLYLGLAAAVRILAVR